MATATTGRCGSGLNASLFLPSGDKELNYCSNGLAHISRAVSKLKVELQIALKFSYFREFWKSTKVQLILITALIEDTCLILGRTAFLLDTFYCTLDDHLKDRRVYNCTLDFDWKLPFVSKR